MINFIQIISIIDTNYINMIRETNRISIDRNMIRKKNNNPLKCN